MPYLDQSGIGVAFKRIVTPHVSVPDLLGLFPPCHRVLSTQAAGLESAKRGDLYSSY